MTTVTLELTDEQRTLLDEVRGELDVATFLLDSGVRVARRRLAHRLTADELTAEHHRRRAAAAMTDSLPLEDFKQLVYDDIAAARAERTK